jgi:CobQ/CobB/MinD/ParA family nucleotide binding protein
LRRDPENRLSPDVRHLIRLLRVPGFRYRDFRVPAAPPRPAPQGGRAFSMALVSLLPGAGRTALCANLMHAARRRGRSASAVDLGDAAAPPSVADFLAQSEVVIVDTPLPPPTHALTEADALLVVVRPDDASLRALRGMEERLARTRMSRWTKAPARYVVNAFDARRRGDREAVSRLRALLGPRVLRTVIQEDPAVSRAMAEGLFLADLAPASQVVADLDGVAREVLPPRRKRAQRSAETR